MGAALIIPCCSQRQTHISHSNQCAGQGCIWYNALQERLTGKRKATDMARPAESGSSMSSWGSHQQGASFTSAASRGRAEEPEEEELAAPSEEQQRVLELVQ